MKLGNMTIQNQKLSIKNILKYSFLFFSKTVFASLICVIFIFIFFNYYIDYAVTPIRNNVINGDDFFVKEYIRVLAVNYSEVPFKLGEYDCSQYAKNLVKGLEKNNISSYCVLGRVKDEEKYFGHVWVEVIINNKTFRIESTSGDYIDEDDYNKNYYEIKKGICA